MTELHSHSDPGEFHYRRLGRIDRPIAAISTGPAAMVYGSTALVAALGWVWLAVSAGGVRAVDGTADLGPGMQLIAPLLAGWAGAEGGFAGWVRYLGQLCTPQPASGFSWAAMAAVFSMWAAMSIAMMLPSAAPMLRTYADIAAAARQKNEAAVPLAVLAAGFLMVWFGFAAVASVLQYALLVSGVSVAAPLPATGGIGALVLFAAGAYQFTPLKQACLDKCRNPFATLFARWSSKPADVLRLGLRQGLFCLGCCWALMTLMFAVGVMNLVWMALIAVLAVIEKSGAAKVTSRLIGFILTGWGGVLAALSLAAI